MYWVFLILTILFGAALVAGFIWFMFGSGRTTPQSGAPLGGAGVGAEIMGAVTDQEEDEEGQVSIPLAEKTWFRGTGASVHSEASLSYAEIRRQLESGNLRQMLPALLLIVGVVGATIFLGLTLLAAGADAIFGLFFVGFGLYVAYLVGSGILRAR
jgi:hypothetical protein